MWKLINVQSQDYLINFQFGAQQSSLRVLVSNFDNLWITEFDEERLLQTFEKFNPLIELDKETLIQEMKNIFVGKRDDVSWDIQIVESSLKLKLESSFACVPFRFEIDFNVINNSLLFQSIVLPLLILVKGIQKQNEYLCDIIKKKDMEITEYKLDGAVLSRKTVETPQFDESVISSILNESIQTVFSKNIDCLLDENLTQHLDRINQLLCKEPADNKTETVNVPPKANEESNLSEPPKKKLMDSKAESKVERINNPKLQQPTIKRVIKVKKRLQNL